ncbi:hypothetical protein ACP4OV_030797 [Aristida adscensionis]
MAALRPVWRWRPSLSSPNAALCLHKMALAGSGTSPASPAGGGHPADRPATAPPASPAPGGVPPAAQPPATPCPADGTEVPGVVTGPFTGAKILEKSSLLGGRGSRLWRLPLPVQDLGRTPSGSTY